MLIEIRVPFYLQVPNGSVNFSVVHSVHYNVDEEVIIINTLTGTAFKEMRYTKEQDGAEYVEMKEQLEKAGFIRTGKQKPKLLSVPQPGVN